MGGAGTPTPRFGIMRNIYVGDSDGAARERVIEAMDVFYAQFTALWRRHGDDRYLQPQDFDRAIDEGRLIAGSAATVRAQLAEMLQASGCNHFAGAFAFGSLSYAEARSSLERFGTRGGPYATQPPPALTPAMSASRMVAARPRPFDPSGSKSGL